MTNTTTTTKLLIPFILLSSASIILEGSFLNTYPHRTKPFKRKNPPNNAKSTPTHTPTKPIKRRKLHTKRPKGYWHNMTNLENELRQFWRMANISIPSGVAPPIPNETLLNYYRRFDLRYGIYSQGGRENISEKLGDAPIVPGKWREAVLFMPDILKEKELMECIPPIAPHVRTVLLRNALNATDVTHHETQKTLDIVAKTRFHGGKRWVHRDNRRPKGYWTEDLLIKELYQYLYNHMKQLNRPCIYMPRITEFTKHQRDDLRYAIQRYGGPATICQKAGLIPFSEWNYFESQYLLLNLLDDYLEQDGYFPPLKEFEMNGAYELHDLIQQFGGRKLVARKLDMRLSKTNPSSYFSEDYLQFQNLNWGPFSLSFAISLLRLVREELLMKQCPPLKSTVIEMPTEEILLKFGKKGRVLIRDIERFGGYECVARRLGLFFRL